MKYSAAAAAIETEVVGASREGLSVDSRFKRNIAEEILCIEVDCEATALIAEDLVDRGFGSILAGWTSSHGEAAFSHVKIENADFDGVRAAVWRNQRTFGVGQRVALLPCILARATRDLHDSSFSNRSVDGDSSTRIWARSRRRPFAN